MAGPGGIIINIKFFEDEYQEALAKADHGWMRWLAHINWQQLADEGFNHVVYNGVMSQFDKSGIVITHKLYRVDTNRYRHRTTVLDSNEGNRRWWGKLVIVVDGNHPSRWGADYRLCRCIDGTPGDYHLHRKHLLPWGGLQCKDIPDRPILELLNRNPSQCYNWYFGGERDVSKVMPPGTPERLVLGKMKMMIRRGVVDGCDCGCRGDFVITEKGQKELENTENS